MLLYLLSIRPKEWQRRCWSQVEEATSGVTVWWSSLKQATSQSWWITSVTLCEVSSPIKSFYWENYWKNCRVYLTGNWFGLIKIELNWKVISVILRPSVSVCVCVCVYPLCFGLRRRECAREHTQDRKAPENQHWVSWAGPPRPPRLGKAVQKGQKVVTLGLFFLIIHLHLLLF